MTSLVIVQSNFWICTVCIIAPLNRVVMIRLRHLWLDFLVMESFIWTWTTYTHFPTFFNANLSNCRVFDFSYYWSLSYVSFIYTIIHAKNLPNGFSHYWRNLEDLGKQTPELNLLLTRPKKKKIFGENFVVWCMKLENRLVRFGLRSVEETKKKTNERGNLQLHHTKETNPLKRLPWVYVYGIPCGLSKLSQIWFWSI